jgi:hypothetical protein
MPCNDCAIAESNINQQEQCLKRLFDSFLLRCIQKGQQLRKIAALDRESVRCQGI